MEELKKNTNSIFLKKWLTGLSPIEIYNILNLDHYPANIQIYGNKFTEVPHLNDKVRELKTKDFKSWNASKWLDLLRESLLQGKDKNKLFSLRSLVLLSNVNICRRLKTYTIILDKEKLKFSVQNTIKYTENNVFKTLSDNSLSETKCRVNVMQKDYLELAKLLQLTFKGAKVAILNSANETAPSISWPMKFGTQEEDIHRRSNLHQCLDNFDSFRDDKGTLKSLYPLEKVSCIFSPEVCFFREGESKGYSLFNKPLYFGVVSCAALYHPDVKCIESDDTTNNLSGTNYISNNTKSKKIVLVEEAEKIILAKMRIMFNACLENGYKTIILVAWGCNAYYNPPDEIARLFAKVIDEYKYRFDNVFFAIPDKEKYDIFKKILYS